MTQFDKLLAKILSGVSDTSIPFKDLCQVLRRLEFTERIKGSHHIYTKDGVPEILNIQPQSNQSKPYQVKQVREIILKYKLNSGNSHEV